MYRSNANDSESWNMEMYHTGETTKRLGEASIKALSLITIKQRGEEKIEVNIQIMIK